MVKRIIFFKRVSYFLFILILATLALGASDFDVTNLTQSDNLVLNDLDLEKLILEKQIQIEEELRQKKLNTHTDGFICNG